VNWAFPRSREPRDRREKAQPERLWHFCKRKDGRHELKVFADTPDGRRKRISVYFSTWEDADAECTRLKDLQRNGDNAFCVIARFL